MKTWSRFPMLLGIMGWALASAWAGPPPEVAAAIQAIQQAPDPSAVVAAFANGMAVARNDEKLHEAYVARMVDLGLPEMAYHQAEWLTTFQSNNGLAWGVVAYVNARRGEMPEAISAINLAGQFAPDNPFVQRTAGEITAWYDTKADKSKLPANAKDGLAKVRSRLEEQPAFAQAYTTAKTAYEAQASASQAPSQAAPGQYAPTPENPAGTLGYGVAAPPPPMYYSDYYYDWGPAWVEPAPWWWWHPVGFFAGFDFFPFATVIVFDHHDFFHHHHHDHFFAHDRFFPGHGFHDRSFNHHGLNVAFHDPNRAFFHRDGQTSFFGMAARPSRSLALSQRANFHSAGGFASGGVMFNSAGQRLNMMPRGVRAAPSFTTPGMPMHTMPMSHGFHGGAPSGGFHGGGFHGGGGGGSHGGGGHR